MTKQLRLASAVLTDVGRKRERNQDNVTQYVPPESEVLDDKGALFVVCDGMGGHAAGEVAAELGVNTIREVYYASQGEDVISSVAHAVKAANEAIYARARQNAEMAGMGTTCVTLIVSGGRAYIVNIGDSRAYIIRDGKMRQVTQDHSWVAEQVRMGLLTEEQARVHAHRNVITRSLGTQPTITADLFVETLHDGDRILMCSDGLHGYVDEAAIEREMLSPVAPDVAVHDLIDMANANGGPDNISAIVVEILEAPEVAGPVPLPPTIDAPIEEGTTQPLPAIPDKAKIAARAATKSAPATPAAVAASKPTLRRKRRGGPLLIAIRILEVAALLVIAVGIWYVGFGPYAQQRNATNQTQTDITRVQTAVQQSKSQDPATALKTLATARQQVIADLNNPNLDATTRQQAQTALQQLQPAVQEAVRRYNAAASIQPVTVTQAIIYPLANCLTPGSTTPTALTSIAALAPVAQPAPKAGTAGTQMLYALSSGNLYQTLTPLGLDGNPHQGDAICDQVVIKGVTSVIALTSVGNTVYALGQDADGKYAVYSVQPQGFNKDGSVNAKISVRVSLPTTGETPTALAVAGNNVYVGFTGGVATPTGLWFFAGAATAPSLTISLPAKAVSLAVGGPTIYLLLSDGSVGQLDAQNIYLPLPVAVPQPALTTDPSIYSVATPVPTPNLTPTGSSATPTDTPTTAPTDTTGAGTPTPTPAPTQPPVSTVGTLFASGATLAIDPTTPTNLLIGDGALNRVVRLVSSATGPGLSLDAQYVYGPPINQASALALAAGTVTTPATGPTATPGTTTTMPILNAYVWSNGELVTFPLPEPTTGA